MLTAERQSNPQLEIAYYCARIWCGQLDSVEETIKGWLEQASQTNVVDEAMANKIRQVLRALIWKHADTNGLTQVQRLEGLRQKWLQIYGKDYLWGTTEPMLVLIHSHYTRFNEIKKTLLITESEFRQAYAEFEQFLQDTHRHPQFVRNVDFYNALIRCNTAIQQITYNLGIKIELRTAQDIVTEMQSNGLTPNRATYLLLLESIVHSPLQFPKNLDEAIKVFHQMEQANVDRRVSKTYELLFQTFPLSSLAYRERNTKPLYGDVEDLPSSDKAFKRLMQLENTMIHVDKFAHTTATMCMLWYRLAAMERFTEIRRRWEQLSNAGVRLEATHYETYVRVASRNRVLASHALNVVFHQLFRERPPIPFDERLLLGFLNCAARLNDPYTTVRLLERMASTPRKPLNELDEEERVDKRRDLNNCLRPITALCIHNASPSLDHPAGITTSAVVESRRTGSFHRPLDQQLLQRLRYLTSTLIIPELDPASSPYPLINYHIEVEQDVPAAVRVLEKHIAYWKENAEKDDDNMNAKQKNPAYFVSVARSLETIIRAFLRQKDLDNARIQLGKLHEHYQYCSIGMSNLLRRHRIRRPLQVPAWQLVIEFVQIALDQQQPTANEHAHWALYELVPQYREVEAFAALHDISNTRLSFDVEWFNEVKNMLKQRTL
jgi:hypothetical protein